MKKLILLILLMFILLTACKNETLSGQVVDKFTVDNKCYLVIETEITPEEYIGYDVGDEYERPIFR